MPVDQPLSRAASGPFAIVGRSLVLPGALDPSAFARMVLDGVDGVGHAPVGRWGLSPRRALAAHGRDAAWSDRGGYVSGFEGVFDPSSVGLSAADAASLDPLFLWALHTASGALRDAGVAAGPRVGVVMGNLSFPTTGMSRFAEHVWLRGAAREVWEAAGLPMVDPRNRFMSGLPALLVARLLGCGGPAFALDAACASGLYAIRLGCELLADGRVDAALVGAVNRSDDLFLHVGFTALQALSRTGQSRPFHRDADGLLPAEGAGFLVLRRLADALEAGERVLAVVRGIAVGNDGRTGGLLAPSADGQARVMAEAWARSGLDPRRCGLLECHATGTKVGDATEIESSGRVFAGARALPVGSFKSNVGHLVTAAGIAGVLKVIAAMEARVRPPTLHVDAPSPALDGSPFRVLTRAEPWDDDVLVGAVSAFGFGGNDAHIVLSAPGEPPSHPAVAPAPRVPVAVVAVGARVGDAPDTAAFVAAVHGERPIGPVADRASLVREDIRFPPRDLERALPQQLLLLAAAMEAWRAAGTVDPARTGCWVGMQADAEVARYGLRWRLGEVADRLALLRGLAHDATEAWLSGARDAVVPVLEPAGVVGTMPNIPANRINAQLDLRGPGFVVCAEEASGLVALDLAARALAAGDVDAAVVGAVDMCAEPVHAAAASAVLSADAPPPGDAAVVFVLRRLDDARRDGQRVLAVLDPDGPAGGLSLRGIGALPGSGHAHAASGLVAAAVGVVCLATGRHPGGAAWAARDGVDVVVDAMAGAVGRARLTAGDPGGFVAGPAGASALTVPAHGPRVVLPPVPPVGAHRQTIPQAPPVPRQLPVEARPPAGPRAAPAPVAAPPPAAPAPAAPVIAPPVTAAAAPPAQVEVVQEHVAYDIAGRSAHPAAVAAVAAAAAAAHRAFLAEQEQMHRRYLAFRAEADRALLTRAPGAPRPAAAWSAPPVAPAPVVAAVVAAAPTAPRPTQATPAPAPKPAAPRPAPVAPAPRPAEPAPPARASAPPAGSLTLDEAGLIVHASGAISTIFGPKFTQQDACFRQVRMPEPPLLLADRVTGIAGAPASMQTGTVWTETDVIPDAWYLHAGRMPAGIMIESGQADLLLISWLGIDLLNRSERVYRLLGCRLTWGRSLPKPGETLRYEIHVDGHANQGPIRLFFFHYDCWVGDGMALQVRGGQAGFFTDGELAASAGVLWDAASAEPCAPFRVDPPRVDRVPRALDSDALEALAAGDGFDALGVGYERLAPHVHTPTIAGGKMRFLHRITDIDPRGGPWGRGWLRAVQDIAPTDWFFDGHFKNDACMPGTLMFEGCLQAMAAYLIVLGYTLDRDGWRFEPVPDHEVDLRCRGQVIPSSKALVYELFVEEVWDGDQPVLWADLLCTADGLKAFHARRMGLRLVPGWPLERRPHQVAEAVDPVPVAVVDGFSFGYRSLLACAHGQPSHAFGSMYEVFDGTRRVARLPGDPYHFMTRVTKIDGPIGVCKPGAKIALEYDIPPEAWYFEENGFPTMPWCVLLEAILQPCGWLASFVGSARTTDRDLSFRNLDGKGRWLVEVLPTAGTLRTEVTITKVSSSAGMIIQQFELVAYLGTIPVFELETVFGFFPKEALATQIGLPPSEDERRALTATSTFFADLTRRGEAADHPFFSGTAHLPTGMLCMMDRITGWWPDGGKAGLGRMRGEKDVVPGEWFFKAHFYQDPVQPGSLGLEAVVQLAQAHLIVSKLVDKVPGGRFEPLAIGEAVEWRYRGQVVPTNHLIRSEVEVLEVTVDARGLLAVFEGWLWVDERRIYQAKRFAVRVVPGGDVPAGLVIDPANDRWIHDHSPTWTVPSLPMMSVVDRLAGAALRDRTGRVVTAVEGVSLKRWITVERPIRVEARAVAAPGRRREVALRVDGALVASGVVEVGVEWPAPPMPWVLPADGLVEQANPYEEGRLFHGPAFQMLERWWLGGGYARGLLRAERDGVPRGTLGQGLLDAITHVIPHDDLGRLVPGVSADKAAYPSTVTWLRLYGPLPMAGALEVVARPAPGVPVAADARFVTIDVQVRRPGARDRVLAELRLVEVLMPKGTIGALPPSDRARFLRDRELVAGAGLGARVGDAVMVQAGDVLRSDWLPGTVRAAWRVDGADVAAEVAAKEAVGTRVGAHPGRVRLVSDPSGGVVDAEPLVRVPVAVTRAGAAYTATSDGPPTLDLRPVSAFWDRWFALGRWPVEDLYYGLAERFVRTVRLADPDGIAGVRGRSVLFLGNHQTGLESLMLSILASALLDTPTVTLAKAEHRTSWLGTLIQLCLAYPGARDPRVITYFEREDKASLVGILAELAQDAAVGRSVMVHVEGTRALTARHRVEKMSSAFLDLAVRMNMPVVPVWFAGGLPVEPLAARSEFPVGLGRQDVLLGAPILPATLAAMPYKERKELVIASINALGDPDHEEPHAPDPDLIARVERRAAATGATFDDAVLLEVLCDRAPGSDGAARVVGGAHEGRLMLGDSPEHRWLGRLARRLYGPRGPEVTGG